MKLLIVGFKKNGRPLPRMWKSLYLRSEGPQFIKEEIDKLPDPFRKVISRSFYRGQIN